MIKKNQFKTNINCSSCLASIKPHLDKVQEISHWDVDLNNKHKILTVESEKLTPEQIMEVIIKAGFKPEPINQ